MSFLINSYLPFPAAGGGPTVFSGHARVALNTSTGNQTLSGITWSDGGSHTPQIAFFEVIGATANATDTDHVIIGYGAYDGTNDVCQATDAVHNLATSDTGSYGSETESVIAIAAGVTIVSGTGVSFGSDSVTINLATAPASAYFVIVRVWAGCDAVECGRGNPSDSADGTTDHTGLGQPCNAMIVITTGTQTGTFDGHNPRGGIGRGFYAYDGTTSRQASMHHTVRTSRGSSEGVIAWLDDRVGSIVPDHFGSRDGDWEISNHASGWTVTTREIATIDADANDFMFVSMAFTGVKAYVGNFDTPTTASPTDKAVTGFGFEPASVYVISSHVDEVSGTSDGASPDADGTCLGSAMSASAEYSASITDHDNEGTMDNQSRSDTYIIHVAVDDGTNTIEGNLKSLDSDGATFEFTVNDLSQDGRCIYLAIENA